MENKLHNRIPLNKRLALNYKRIVDEMPNEAEAYYNLSDRLRAAEIHRYAISQEQIMPSFLLPDENGLFVRMEDLTSKGPLIITFNNGHWCTFCEIELTDLREHHAEIKAAGADIVAISSMDRGSASQLVDRLNLTFHILTDAHNGYALLVGLAVRLVKSFSRLNYSVTRQNNKATAFPLIHDA